MIARTSSFSFKGRGAEIQEIGDALGVTHVLEGSVRKSGSRIRVIARLVDTSDGTRVWSDSYDLELLNILALQSEIAASVATALKANLQGQALTAAWAASSVDAEAYDLYLRGQQHLRMYVGTAYADAARFFERSIEIDPEFIPAYSGLGQAYVLQVVDIQAPMSEMRVKLRDIVERGLKRAPEDAGLIGLSGHLARWNRDFELAEHRFQLALQKDPANISVRAIYASFKLDRSYADEALELTLRLLEIDPLNPQHYIGLWACHLDLWNAEEAIAAASHRDKVAAAADRIGYGQIGIVRLLLLGDVAGSIGYLSSEADADRQNPEISGEPYAPSLLYYFIGDLETGDLAAETERIRSVGDSSMGMVAVDAYRHVAYDDIERARQVAVAVVTEPKIWAGLFTDQVTLRLAVDALIRRGEPQRAVDFIETLAPDYARYRMRREIAAQSFSPAPVALKSAYSSYPALYFPDYVRALRAAGDEEGADNMLGHLDAILALRRQRGLFIEERHAGEALALRGRTEAAIDALEQAERDRTIYQNWQLFVLHNESFAGFRDHPRFAALIERIRDEMKRQREELRRSAHGA